MLFHRDFILKPTEGALVLLKNSAKDFQNSRPYKRSACFFVTITGNLERFQYEVLNKLCLKSLEKTFSEKWKPFSKNWLTIF